MEIYIYQFNSPEGGNESIYIQLEKLSDIELEDITPPNTVFEQVVTCNITAGDAGILPTDRRLIPSF